MIVFFYDKHCKKKLQGEHIKEDISGKISTLFLFLNIIFEIIIITITITLFKHENTINIKIVLIDNILLYFMNFESPTCTIVATFLRSQWISLDPRRYTYEKHLHFSKVSMLMNKFILWGLSKRLVYN